MNDVVQAQNNDKKDEIKRLLKVYVVVALIFVIAGLVVPAELDNYELFSIIPAAFLLGYIFYTKRILEALAFGALLGYVMKYKFSFFGPVNEELLGIMMDGDIAWLFITCGLMGSIVTLMEKAGGAFAFGEWVAKRAKTGKSALMWTWILGVIIFVDDYLSCLTLGTSMTSVTDRYKTPREMLAYIVDATSGPVCVIFPITTWAIFLGSLMEQNGLAPKGEGLTYFIKTIPFNYYGWIATLIVPLVILGIIPTFGPMKKAVERAEKTGVLAPPGSDKIDMKAGETAETPKKPNIWNFFLPIFVLSAATVYFDMDMQMGVVATVGFMFLLYIPQGIMNPEEFADQVLIGVKSLIMPLVMVVLAYLFAAASEEVGFIAYLIDTGKQFMTPQLFPFVVFVIFGITEFIMGLSWGMYVIAMPIVIPLAAALGANPFVAVGAVISAGAFGSHICFYSDLTILSSSSAGCENFRHAVTQLPYGLIGVTLSAILYLVTGFIVG